MKCSLRNILFLTVVGSAALGCSKKDKESEAPAEKPTAAPTEATDKTTDPAPAAVPDKPAAAAIDAATAAEPTAAAAGDVDLGNWDQYWPEFKKAATAKDMEALKALTEIGGEIDQGTFDMLGDSFLTKEVMETLAKTDAAGVKAQDGTEGTAEEIREFSWSETAMVDGEEMGSGLFFYFKKIDGKYKLFRLLAAG